MEPHGTSRDYDVMRIAAFDFLQTPRLRLTTAQAARLWRVDPSTCRRLLDDFVADGFLVRDAHGNYERPLR